MKITCGRREKKRAYRLAYIMYSSLMKAALHHDNDIIDKG